MRSLVFVYFVFHAYFEHLRNAIFWKFNRIFRAILNIISSQTRNRSIVHCIIVFEAGLGGWHKIFERSSEFEKFVIWNVIIHDAGNAD